MRDASERSRCTELLIEIAACELASAAWNGEVSNCSEIVSSQRLFGISKLQCPEPWSGDLRSARLLFISSNPSIDPNEAYPDTSWSREETIDFFQGRFQPPFVKDFKYARLKSGQYSKPVHYWGSIRNRAKELFLRDVTPGEDFALTEVVHCKSRKQEGVKSALSTCASRFLFRIIGLAGAVVVVVVGTPALEQFNTLGVKDLSRGNRMVRWMNRYLVWLPHPVSPEPKTFVETFTHAELSELRGALRRVAGKGTDRAAY